ncbi:hypothetical protein GCM10027445_60540 [Amycolatopsis endophytica]
MLREDAAAVGVREQQVVEIGDEPRSVSGPARAAFGRAHSPRPWSPGNTQVAPRSIRRPPGVVTPLSGLHVGDTHRSECREVAHDQILQRGRPGW